VKVKAEPEVEAASASASPAPSAPAKKKKKRGWKGWALVVEDDDGNLLEVREDGSPPPDSVPAEKTTARQRKSQIRQTSVPGGESFGQSWECSIEVQADTSGLDQKPKPDQRRGLLI
jgi:hypothetical protein